MTWVTLPLPKHGSLSREQRTVQTLADGEECRVRLADGTEAEATWVDGRGWRDEDGEPIEQVAAVWVRPAGGPSGAGGKTDLVRLPPVYVTPQERERYMALAANKGESVSTWARRKLAT